ncbi:hypothetical protein BGZ96_008946 [Linnemannia gamsii]|uniref:Fatty acid desaturase domain-containing protein n=1 Tax=Linnemannia gamsii TaxID=64522 RepID=A0ABQ7KEP6_9FUNG|nr:hypothetical protein BGZ96_008946 [Linnemannia gamsii]
MTVAAEQPEPHVAQIVEEDVEDTLSDTEDSAEAATSTTTTTNGTGGVLLSPAKAANQATNTTAAGEAAPSTRVKRLALISSEDLKTPTIAIPTIAVAAGSVGAWASIMYYGAYKKKFSPLVSFPFMTAAIFASFTPVHDGTHSSIAKGKYKIPVNNLVGYISGVPLTLPFGSYRQLHLLHHRHVNTDADPDIWDSQGPMVVRAIKWFFPDFFWIRQILTKKVKNGKILDASIFYLSILWIFKKMSDKNMSFVKYWLLPQRAAYWLLVWLFAYVPHRPDGDHQFNQKDNVYKTTSVTGGILNSNGFNLAIPLLNQHLHNIHHLYPQLPFTRYGKIWAKHKDALIAAGTETHPVYEAKKDWAWNETFDGKKK